MTVAPVDSRTAAPAAAAPIVGARFVPNSPASPVAPSSSDVIRRMSDLLDLSPKGAAARLPVVTFEDASAREYLNVTAKLLKAGSETRAGAAETYGRDGKAVEPPPPARVDVRI